MVEHQEQSQAKREWGETSRPRGGRGEIVQAGAWELRVSQSETFLIGYHSRSG